MPATDTKLERDLDGYVHTPSGFLPRAQYEMIRRQNPGAGLPPWEAIPVIGDDERKRDQ